MFLSPLVFETCVLKLSFWFFGSLRCFIFLNYFIGSLLILKWGMFFVFVQLKNTTIAIVSSTWSRKLLSQSAARCICISLKLLLIILVYVCILFGERNFKSSVCNLVYVRSYFFLCNLEEIFF